MAVSLNANALISIVELDEILRITIGDSDLSATLINIASDSINNYTNRKILSRTYTEEAYDGNNDTKIYLKQYPVTAVSSVESWDTYNNESSYTYTEHTEYIVYTDEGYIYLRGLTVPGHKNYRITYTAGYVLADVPYDLKNACAQLAGLVYYNKGKAGIKSETMGKYSITYNNGNFAIAGIPIPDDIAGVIRQYKKYNV